MDKSIGFMKSTKFWKNLPLLFIFTLLSKCQKKWEFFSNFVAFSQYLNFNKMFQCVMFIQQGRRKKLGVCSTWFPFLYYNTMAHLPLLPVWRSRDRISIWKFFKNFFFEFNESLKLIQSLLLKLISSIIKDF